MLHMIIRVVEFGSYLAGPLVGKYLVDAGFEVTCVCKPMHLPESLAEYEYMKHTLHDLRRHKRMVELDLKCQLREARALIAQSNVLIENMGRDVMERLGLGYESCRCINPRLIYVSIPGYSQHDNHQQPKPWDSILMASSGVFCDMGLNRTLLGVKASFSSLPMPSVYASIFAAFAAACAVFDACNDGDSEGVFIEVPLASALSEALVHNSIQFPLDDTYKCLRTLRIDSQEYPVSYAVWEQLLDPFFTKYICADGRPIYLVCPSHARHQQNALRILGIYDDVCRLVPHNMSLYSGQRVHGIGSARLSESQCKAVRPLLQSAFAQRTAMEWENVMGQNGVPIVAHRSTEEWVMSSHAMKSGLVSGSESRRVMLSPLVWHHPTARASTPCAATDQRHHSSHRFSDQKLSNVRVLDLTNVIAGPTIGAMLARMGAEVIKIDSPNPMYAPDITVVYGIVVNIGKRSILLDISRSGGRRALEKLIQRSDLILINSTEACLRRMCLTPTDLRRINPNILQVRFDAWGGPLESGDFKEFVGYDDNVQAGIGIMERFGGSLIDAEEHAHIGTIDVIAGVAGAFAAVISLLRRKMSGEIAHARTSLAAVGQYLQYPFMFGRTLPSVGRGVTCRGVHALHQCYRTADGWIVLVACLDAEVAEGMWDRNTLLQSFTSTGLASFIAQHTSLRICTLLADHGIAATPLRTLNDVRSENVVSSARRDGPSYQFIVSSRHPIGCVTMVAPVAIRMRRIRYDGCHAPKYGADTLKILSWLGETKLLLCGDASVAWSRHYIPYCSMCDVCTEKASAVSLRCCHRICHECIDRMNEARRHACPICHRPHEMNVMELRSITLRWTHEYGRWRRGYTRGARDMSRRFEPKRALRRVHSEPMLHVNTLSQGTSPTSNRSSSTQLSNGTNA